MRERIVRSLFRLAPFELGGDCLVPPARDGVVLSCIVNFYGRLDLLRGILCSLSDQNFPRHSFEVILVEDRGGTDEGKRAVAEYADRLPVRYLPLDKHFGRMGYSRNFGLAHSRGEYVLFLDDDTVLLQPDFLELLVQKFQEQREIDAVVPRGWASFALIEGRYDFHEPYFMTSRCTAYRRRVLAELQGFMDQFVGQEDVEFVIRFLLSGRKSFNFPRLNYFHPPLLVGNMRKPMAVGHSFGGLRKRYSFFIWLMVLANCSRHAPLYLLPGQRNREMGRFGLGFIAGVVASFFKKTGFQYG